MVINFVMVHISYIEATGILLPSALARGIVSRIVARIGSKCCMYVYMYVCMYVFPVTLLECN